jgi:hypothetical protein
MEPLAGLRSRGREAGRLSDKPETSREGAEPERGRPGGAVIAQSREPIGETDSPEPSLCLEPRSLSPGAKDNRGAGEPGSLFPAVVFSFPAVVPALPCSRPLLAFREPPGAGFEAAGAGSLPGCLKRSEEKRQQRLVSFACVFYFGFSVVFHNGSRPALN